MVQLKTDDITDLVRGSDLPDEELERQISDRFPANLIERWQGEILSIPSIKGSDKNGD